MANSLGIAIIGCGWAGRTHADAFVDADVSVEWAIDTDGDRAVALANRFDTATASTDYDRALADPAVDAVDVCLPHHLHEEVTVAAARKGKHVLCEKPIADSLTAADNMIRAAEDQGVVLMIGENVHFDPTVKEIQKILETGVIGAPALAQVSRQANLEEDFLSRREWFLDEEAAGGGIMMSGGIHDIEMLRLILDAEPVSVYANRARQRFDEMDGDDTSVATLRFDDGTVAVLVESFTMKSLDTAAGGEVHTVRIDGDHGSISTTGDLIQLYSERQDVSWSDGPVDKRVSVPDEDPFKQQTVHFIDCVRTGRTPVTDGESQRELLRIVKTAYESMTVDEVISL